MNNNITGKVIVIIGASSAWRSKRTPFIRGGARSSCSARVGRGASTP